jgi:gamma-tubulin complex component 2
VCPYQFAFSSHTGFGCFTLDYKAQWPVSLVLSRKALTQYQLLFRLLFYCKRVRNGLDSAWLWHQSMKELPHVRALLAHTFLLRQRYISPPFSNQLPWGVDSRRAGVGCCTW